VAYEVVVDEAGRLIGDGTANWRRLVELQGALPFLVVDESGEARVDTSGPFLMALNYDRTGDTSGWFRKYPGKYQALASFLSSIDVVTTNWLGKWRPFRYAEGVLEEGELVSVSADSALEADQMGRERALGPHLDASSCVARRRAPS